MARPGLAVAVDRSRFAGSLRKSHARIGRPIARSRRRRSIYNLTLMGTQEDIDLRTRALAASTPYIKQDLINIYIDTTVGGTTASGFALTTGNFRTINPRARLRIYVRAGKVLGKGGAVGALGGKAIRCDMPCSIIYMSDIASGGNGGANGASGGDCYSIDTSGAKNACSGCCVFSGSASGGSGGGGAGYNPTSGASQIAPGSGSGGSSCGCNFEGCCGGGLTGGGGTPGSDLGTNTAIEMNGFLVRLIPAGGSIVGAIMT